MAGIETLSDQQRRLMAHIYAALRDNIRDEVEYDRTPDFEPLDEEAIAAMTQVISEQITELMFTAHDEEATTIEAEIDVYVINWQRTVGADRQ